MRCDNCGQIDEPYRAPDGQWRCRWCDQVILTEPAPAQADMPAAEPDEPKPEPGTARKRPARR